MNVKSVTTLFLFALLTQASAMACPLLSGNYTCHDPQSGDFEITISQKNSGAAVDYVLDTHGDGTHFDVLTDGKSHAIPDSDEFRNGTYTATCAGARLLADATAILIDDQNQADGNVVAHFDISLDNVMALNTKITGKVASSQQNYQLNGTFVCKHK